MQYSGQFSNIKENKTSEILSEFAEEFKRIFNIVRLEPNQQCLKYSFWRVLQIQRIQHRKFGNNQKFKKYLRQGITLNELIEYDLKKVLCIETKINSILLVRYQYNIFQQKSLQIQGDIFIISYINALYQKVMSVQNQNTYLFFFSTFDIIPQ
ncbi:unnamed protein product [Paramecium pentaurelia]|uniref:Uncharacterized protein n=1 Tax=Paramecium pentaurelia TaxID=43138 RepID=A0A8S1V5A5_9CILI|nr:unnamed protein product [Paramecium pentaurelia]